MSNFKKYFIAYCTVIILIIIITVYAETLPVNMSNYYYQYVELSAEFQELEFDEYHVFYKWSEVYDLDIRLVISIAMTESNLNHYVRHKQNPNGTRDYGIMGINSAYGTKEELMNIDYNIKFGCRYLRSCLDSTDNFEKAVGRYNAGLNSKWLNKKYADVVLAYY